MDNWPTIYWQFGTELVFRVIMENTVGSRYYKNEQKRDAQVQERILKMKARFQLFSVLEKAAAMDKVR